MTAFFIFFSLTAMSLAAVNSQTYYIGDPIQVSFLATLFPPPARQVTSFYLKTTQSKVQFDYINPIPMNHLNIVAKLTMTAGRITSLTRDMAVVQPLSGKGVIYGEDDIGHSAIVATVFYDRHIRIQNRPMNTIFTEKTAPRQIVVSYAGTSTTNLLLPNAWAVALVDYNGFHLQIVAVCVFNVTKVHQISSTAYNLMGYWTTWSSERALYLLVGNNMGKGLQSFSLAGDSVASDMAWMTVDSVSVHLPATLPFASAARFQLAFDTRVVQGYVWIRLRSFRDSYLLGCEAFDYNGMDFDFPWQVLTAKGAFSTFLPIGDYVVDLIWSKDQTHPKQGSLVTGPVYPTNQRVQITPHPANSPLPITIRILVDLLPHQFTAINLTSIFDTVYLQWFTFAGNTTHNNTNSTGWEPISSVMQKSVVPGHTTFMQLKVPASFAKKGMIDYGRLYGWSLDCRGNKFMASFGSRHIIRKPTGTVLRRLWRRLMTVLGY